MVVGSTRQQVAAFNAALQRWAKVQVPEAVGRVTRTIALEALTRIVQRTPVDTGRARGGWQVDLSAPPVGSGAGPDRSGSLTIAAGAARIEQARPFEVIFIGNHVPYILVLENGGFRPPDPGPSKDKRKGRFGRVLVEGGYSVQAPRGMVGITLEELRGVFP